MKPFLGVDLTEDKKNETFNGDEFIVKKPREELSETLEQGSDEVLGKIKASNLPIAVKLIQYLCGGFAVIVASSFIQVLVGEDRVPIATAYRNACGLLWAAAVCLIVWIVLTVIGYRKQKKELGGEEFEQANNEMTSSADLILAELGVPADAREVDVLSFHYKMKDGGPKLASNRGSLLDYINFNFHLYSDADTLYLADVDGVYAFPRTSLRAIRTVHKRIAAFSWFKDEEIKSEIYKPFKLRETDYGGASFPWHHILELEIDGEMWGIWFPNYELDAFERATGLRATDLPEK